MFIRQAWKVWPYGYASVGGMQVEDINAVRLQLGQACIKLFPENFGLVKAWLMRIDLGRERQAPVLPPSRSRKGFLFTTDIDPSGIKLVVALTLKVVEDLVVLIERGNAGAGILVWACKEASRQPLKGRDFSRRGKSASREIPTRLSSNPE